MFGKYIQSLGISLLAIFAPVQSMISAVVVLTLSDLVFGVVAARIQKIPITSSELKRTPIKIFVYLAALILGFITQKYLMNDIMPLSNLVSTLIGVTELKSILESLDIIYGKPILALVIERIVDKSKGDR